MLKVVDAMGKACPLPVVEAKKAIAEIEKPGTVEVHVDNTTAVENLKRLADKLGGVAKEKEIEQGHYTVAIRVEEEASAVSEEVCSCEVQKNKGNTVVVFAGNTMGLGDEELGTTLIKGFIYALSQLDTLPKTCIFYNSGAKLTAEGSAVLDDIKAMEADGVEIKTCGTCANFYGLEGKICVGSVTNMYDIVETMNEADKIIKP